jgi:hypothetical protein
MSSIEHLNESAEIHPIDIVESIAEDHDWQFDRVCDDQIAMSIDGRWRAYSLTLAWSARDEMLRLICAFDLPVATRRQRAVSEAINLANDLCWLGAFTLWPDRRLMAYRYALTLAGGSVALPSQISEMVRSAVAASERFLPAFQLVAAGDSTPDAAMAMAIGRTFGRA